MNRCYDFLGDEVSGERERVAVIPVPVEDSTSYIRGTARAPEAILDASRQIELYNSLLDLDLEGSGIVTFEAGIKIRDDLTRFLEENAASLKNIFPVFIGGEHSVTPLILEKIDMEGAGIVWLDAHADLRESYEGDPASHACAARNSLGFGPMVEIGVRSISSGEMDFLKKEGGVKIHRSWNDEAKESILSLPGKIYLSIDFDSVDPSLLRAVGTPEPGGLDWNAMIDIFSFLFKEKQVVAMDAVELCPIEGDEASNFIAARIVYEAVSNHLAREV